MSEPRTIKSAVPSKLHTAAEEVNASNPSSVSAFCAGLMEACWLGALAIVPVLFNPHGFMGFQPNKVIFLRLFASITLVAWIIRAFERKPAISCIAARLRVLLKVPVVLALAGLVLAYGIATCLSVCPWVSFSGSPEYMQGTLTFLAQLVILASVAACLRTQEQINRLVTVIAAGSLPVALYAMFQRSGIDPLHVNLDKIRVCSTTGHPIYLGGYLLMVLPLTMWRVWQLAHSLRIDADCGNRLLKRATIVFYSGVIGIQLVGFLCAQSRGPLIGLGAALAFLAVSLSIRRRDWRLLATAATVGLLSVGGLLFMGLQKGFFARLASVPALEHFARTLPIGSRADSFRYDIWNAAPRVILAPVPLPFALGGEDRFHWLRPLFGYGPETVQNVLPHFFTSPDLLANIENRFHNLVWDNWFAIGGFGLAAFLGFFLLLFFKAYCHLGSGQLTALQAFILALCLGRCRRGSPLHLGHRGLRVLRAGIVPWNCLGIDFVSPGCRPIARGGFDPGLLGEKRATADRPPGRTGWPPRGYGLCISNHSQSAPRRRLLGIAYFPGSSERASLRSG